VLVKSIVVDFVLDFGIGCKAFVVVVIVVVDEMIVVVDKVVQDSAFGIDYRNRKIEIGCVIG
ncbi:hypothetical protein Tco_0697489, partial [Tanacetum coccineum]